MSISAATVLVVAVTVFALQIHVVISATASASDFPGTYSKGRLAYYRWQEWILSQPAVVRKVPPVPASRSWAPSADRLNVTVECQPVSVFEVNQAMQTIRLTVALIFNWTDPALDVYAQGAVHNITNGNYSVLPAFVTIPADNLWLPTIVNSEGTSKIQLLELAGKVDIHPTGSITIMLAADLTINCRFDMTKYPFDEHHCGITIVDGENAANVVPKSLTWDSGLAEGFGVVGEWELLNLEISEKLYRGYQAYTVFELHLRRKTLFYKVIVVLPLVMTSYLNVLVFLLPPDLGDKLSYLVTVTVSLSVFSSFFTTDMPRGLDSLPTIFSLYIFILAESFLTFLVSLYVIRKAKVEQIHQEASEKETSGGLRLEVGEKETSGGLRLEVGEKETSGGLGVKQGRVAPFPATPQNAKKFALSRFINVSAKNVDTFFFLLSLCVNTIGLAVILSKMML